MQMYSTNRVKQGRATVERTMSLLLNEKKKIVSITFNLMNTILFERYMQFAATAFVRSGRW